MKAKISTGTYTLFERFFPKLFDLQKNNLEIGTTLIEAPFVVDFAHAKLEIERPTLALITICCFLLSFGLFAALYCYETKQRGRILGFANFWASVMFLDAFFLHCLWEDSWMFTTVFYLLDIVPTGLAGLHLCLYALNFEIPTFLLIIFDAGVFYFAYDNLNTIMVEMVYLGPLLFAGGLLVISLISQFGWTNGKWLCLAVFIQQLATISLGFEAKLVEIDPRLNNVNLFFAASSLIMLCITNHHWANFPATTKYKLMNKVEAPAPSEGGKKKGKRNNKKRRS